MFKEENKLDWEFELEAACVKDSPTEATDLKFSVLYWAIIFAIGHDPDFEQRKHFK